MSNLIVLLEIATLARRLKRSPLSCVDLNSCGFNSISAVHRWPWTTNQPRWSVAWRGLPEPRSEALPGGAGGGAEGTAPIMVLKGQLWTPLPHRQLRPRLLPPRRATSPACCFLWKDFIKDLLGREHEELKGSRARQSAEIWSTVTVPPIYGVWLLLEGGGVL